ncbi:MAG: class I SAM-dependent RNA methyltransferase [Kiritimatiellae bacterium]|nr:class I SAM-dependent RNA methyltransferase [Kiritimatiellia bacterium]
MDDPWTSSGEIGLACARGLASFARREAESMGFEILSADDSSVGVRGTLMDAMRLNLWLRTAHRVLWPVARVPAKNLDHLFAHASEIPWEQWLREDVHFTVHGVVRNDTVRDTRLPMLRLKDAIADRLRAVCGRRPDSGPGFAGAAVFLLWRERDLRIFLDTTGEPLSRRGYRLLPGKAPMQETLAAACVMAAGWDGKTSFVVPMCGSGTPAIEAVLMARGRAPARGRERFAFMNLRGYEDGGNASPACRWQAALRQAEEGERRDGLPAIVATDISAEAVRIARANAEAAGVGGDIAFAICDFAATHMPPGPGVIFMNPEYGERLGETDALLPVYRRIGAFLRAQADFRGCVLTGSRRLADAIGLPARRSHRFYNGPIECRLLCYGVQGDANDRR